MQRATTWDVGTNVTVTRAAAWAALRGVQSSRTAGWDVLVIVGSEILTPDRLDATVRPVAMSAQTHTRRLRATTTAPTVSVTTHAADLGGQLREEP